LSRSSTKAEQTVQLPTCPDLVPKLRIKELVSLFPVCLHGTKREKFLSAA